MTSARSSRASAVSHVDQRVLAARGVMQPFSPGAASSWTAAASSLDCSRPPPVPCAQLATPVLNSRTVASCLGSPDTERGVHSRWMSISGVSFPDLVQGFTFRRGNMGMGGFGFGSTFKRPLPGVGTWYLLRRRVVGVWAPRLLVSFFPLLCGASCNRAQKFEGNLLIRSITHDDGRR